MAKKRSKLKISQEEAWRTEAETAMVQKIAEAYKKIGETSKVAAILNIPLWVVEKTLTKGNWCGLYKFNWSHHRGLGCEQRKKEYGKAEKNTKSASPELYSWEIGPRKRKLIMDLDYYEGNNE